MSVATTACHEPRPTSQLPFSIDRGQDHARAVDYILDELFFAVGQVVGQRKSLDYDAVIWWRDHYRAAFLAAMRRGGAQWERDRHAVSGVAMLLAERAVRYAEGETSITVASVIKATEDAQRYCELHARRHARPSGPTDELPRLAGYWCVPDPPPEE